MSELSIFIDESGDFGPVQNHNDYYLVSFVIHEQDNDISEEVKKLEKSVHDAGFNIEYIHTEPVIRREGIFYDLTLDERRQLLYKLLNFTVKCPFKYHTIAIKRREAKDKVQLSGKIGKEIGTFLMNHLDFFQSFDRVIVYYDNGQSELSSILNALFSVWIKGVEFRKAEPQKYRLLQVADFCCTMELLRIKREEKRLSKSEEKFFYKPQELQKTFLKSIAKKRLEQ